VSNDIQNETHLKVAEALVQFVDESIMRPNASQRPILASHPAAMLVFHLKGYMYAANDVIAKRLIHNVRTADTTAQQLAMMAPAFALLALTALGLELREWIKYMGSGRTPPTDNMDGFDYLTELITRSGITGAYQLGFDVTEADERGATALAALAGPTINQISDFMVKPATQTIPKSIPVIGQIQGGRDAVRTIL
jgi:hypothetical protein